MLQLRGLSSGKIHIVFILGLFTMFVATSFLLILIGIKQYNYTQEAAGDNYVQRTISSYVQEKIRQHDSVGCIYVTELDGCTALALVSKGENVEFTTYIYCYEGTLRELVVTDSSIYSLSSGQKIMALQGFLPEQISPECICITITTQEESYQLYFSPECREGKEAQ